MDFEINLVCLNVALALLRVKVAVLVPVGEALFFEQQYGGLSARFVFFLFFFTPFNALLF